MQLSMLPATLLALIPLASAGYSYGGGSGNGPSNTPPANAGGAAAQTENGATIIKVGETPLTMTPNSVTVPAGQWIEFHFYQGAHSVAQSAFDTPCTPLVNGTTVGFFSGPQQVQPGAKGANVFQVMSTGAPMWFYCATGNHCQQGMVGVINAPPNNPNRTIALYAQRAANARSNVAPAAIGGGNVVPATDGTPTGGAAGPSTTPSAGVGMLGQLSMPLLGLAAVVAAVGL